MPANMMSDPAGSSLNVTGSSSATVSAGPMPGRTPTAVPSSTPINANRRFIGCSAMRRPWPSAEIGSMGAPSEQPLERSRRKGQRQELGEHQIGAEAEREPDREISQDRAAAERGGGGGEQDRHR